MVDPRRYLGTFAVLALVLLRLVIGWHFFREGTAKIEYDRHDGEIRMVFSAEGFLKQAKGPLAPWYHAQVPDDHGWGASLAAPRENKVLTADVENSQVKWESDYKKRREAAIEAGEMAPFEFAPSTPYYEWANQIVADWRGTLEEFQATPGLSQEQIQKAQATFEARAEQLADYLAGQSEAIAEYRHELWRLDHWRESAEAGGVPFVDERIAAKNSELSATPRQWIQEVRLIESNYHQQLHDILTDEQRENATTTEAIDNALSDSRHNRLATINLVVTVLTITVGICLLLGFFTRLASIVGALFLAGVIASQPPWLYDAAPTMPNIIEFVALLVLAGTGAGRWLGLDFFTYALFHRDRTRD